MSANPEILTLPAQDLAAKPSATPPPPQARKRRARTGKVARLPYPVRLKINLMLDDAVPYEKLIENLGPDGAGLTPHHISEWKSGGYQDYLQDSFWQNEMRARQETFTGLLTGTDPVSLPEGGLQLAVTGICELLRDLCNAEGQPDPNTYVRAANSLARLSRSILTLQEYRDASAKAATALLTRKDLNREFTDAEYDLVTDRMDDFFRKPRRPRSGPGAAIVGQASTPAVSEATPPLEIPIPNPVGSPIAVTMSATAAEPPESHACNPPPSPVPNPNCEVAPAPPPRETTVDSPASSTLPPPPPLQPPPRVESVPVAPPLPHLAPQPPIDEFCLECGTRLPPLRDGARIYAHCGTCHIRLPPAGTCRFPSNEQCPKCKANLPRLLPSGARPDPWCQNCGTSLPPPAPTLRPPAPASSPQAPAPPSLLEPAELSSARSKSSSSSSS